MVRIRVRKFDLAWHVRADGFSPRRVDTLCTRERALEHAHELADRIRAWDKDVLIDVEDAAGLHAVA